MEWDEPVVPKDPPPEGFPVDKLESNRIRPNSVIFHLKKKKEKRLDSDNKNDNTNT